MPASNPILFPCGRRVTARRRSRHGKPSPGTATARPACTWDTCYRNGIGVEGDDALAAKWYRQAAQAGHAEAQYELGLMYELGIGVPGDPGEAAYWYGLATTEFCPAELSAGGRLGDR